MTNPHRCRRRGPIVLLALVLAATACLPIPADVVAFACGRTFDVGDDRAVHDHLEELFPGYHAGIASPPEVIYANLQALNSASLSALGPKIAGVWVSRDLSRAVIGLTDALDDMATIIEAIAPYPDEIVIEDRRVDAALGDTIWARIQELGVDDDPAAGTPNVGFLRDGLVVNLPPTGDAADLATELRALHGDRLSINVGSRRLGGGPEFDTGPCIASLPRWVIGDAVPDNVVVNTVVDTPTVSVGGRVTGRIIITNNGTAPVEVRNPHSDNCRPADQPLTTTDRQFTVNGSTLGAPPGLLQVHDVGEGYPLRYSTGVASNDWSVPPPPPDELDARCTFATRGGEIRTGETQTLDFVADTQSSRPEEVLLPPGDYLVRPMLSIHVRFVGPFGPVALPPAPVTLTA